MGSITTNSTTQTRSAHKHNEITAVSGATTPAYDSNVNLTKDENNYRFVYDAWNLVVQVKNLSNVGIVTYGRNCLQARDCGKACHWFLPVHLFRS